MQHRRLTCAHAASEIDDEAAANPGKYDVQSRKIKRERKTGRNENNTPLAEKEV